jgi:hypothetical protein
MHVQNSIQSLGVAIPTDCSFAQMVPIIESNKQIIEILLNNLN